jgi:hypothetical protein
MEVLSLDSVEGDVEVASKRGVVVLLGVPET